MASLATSIKNCLAALAALLLGSGVAGAADFQAQRGVNLDLWVTWPEEERWGDPDALLPFPEWRETVGEAELLILKETGFDFVRMPIDPSVFLSERTAGLHERLLEEIVASTRLISGTGLKVLVDLHLIPRSDNPAIGMEGAMEDGKTFDTYLEAVRRVARALSQEDSEMVALELMNEPGAECGADSPWPDMLQRLFAAARSSATRLTLVLSGACGGSAEGLAALDPKQIPDDNVIWTFHSYQPFLLTHQGALWAGDFIRYVTGLPYPPHAAQLAELRAAVEQIRNRIRAEAPWTRRAGMLAYLDEQLAEIDTPERLAQVLEGPFATVRVWAEQHEIANENILLGEFGMMRQEHGNPFVMPGEWRAAYAKDVIGIAERYGFGWSLWSYGGAFGIVEEFEGRKAEPHVLDVVRRLPPPAE